MQIQASAIKAGLVARGGCRLPTETQVRLAPQIQATVRKVGLLFRGGCCLAIEKQAR